MPAYTRKLNSEEKAAKASISHLRVHYKHCREIGEAIKGRKIESATKYLENVLQYKEAIPFTKYNGSTGRHAQAKQCKGVTKTSGDQVGWPQKATRSFVDLLKNLAANAKAKSLEIESMVITHANCQQAPKMRRRTYRAHGRVNAYMSSPAHIQLIAEEEGQEIAKEADPVAKLTKKRAAQVAQEKAKHAKVVASKRKVPVGGN
jgi:large subunit ribosomal protein L17e